MINSDNYQLSRLLYLIRKKGLQVDDTDRIIYFDYLNPEVTQTTEIKKIRKIYNYRCQAQIQ